MVDHNFEIQAQFADLASWKRWLEQNPWSVESDYVAAIVRHVRLEGLFDPLQGHAPPSEISIDERNLRESVIFRGINSRCRAVLKVLVDANFSHSSVVYAPESLSALASLIRGHFENFIGSEYLPTDVDRGRFPGTRHEDVQALTFDDETIDAYVSCEVMEHVPSMSKTLRETSRVLRPGGAFIATFPFRLLEQSTLVKAVLENGSARFVMEPEYHGNPVDSQGSLVFSIPGWDILDLARTCGFSRAEMTAISSRRHGIVAKVPMLVMTAVK